MDIPDWSRRADRVSVRRKRRQLRECGRVSIAARNLDRYAAFILRRVQSPDSMVGEHSDSRVPRPARAMPDVRRDDSLPPLPRGAVARSRRRLPLSALPAARCVRALRVLRRALHRRADRLRLAADSEHHNLSRNSDRIAGRDVYDPGGWTEALADRHRGRMGIPVPHRRSLFLAAQSRRAWAWATCGCSEWSAHSPDGQARPSRFSSARFWDRSADFSRRCSGARAAPPVVEDAAGTGETETSVLRTEVPFGPFLALAAGVFALFQPQITHWYLGH